MIMASMVLKPCKILHFKPLILLVLALPIFVSSHSDHTNFVYKKCRNRTHIPDNLVSSLIQELVDKSSKSKFYQTSSGDDTLAVSGVFQCRGDLTNHQCHACILNTLPRLSCGSNFPARVQLKSCYLSLEPEPELELEPELNVDEGSRINSRSLIAFVQKDYLQHKKCGERGAQLKGLEELKDAAFEVITRCVMSSIDRHCAKTYEGMYAMGQCEGSLGECECGECTSKAFQVARDECWGSDSGEVYLEKCFVSFGDDESHKGQRNFSEEKGIGGGSAKLVAMVVGIGVALGLLSALCYCIRSFRRKHDDW